MTSDTAAAESRDPGDALCRHVRAKAHALQEGYKRDAPKAVSSLARLRRALVADRMLSPDAWDALDGFPEWLMWERDEPTAEEWAAVASLSIFARHVQSRREQGAHASGHDHALGRVVGRVATDQGPGFERRFRALTRVPDHVAALPHLRGIVALLRAADRPAPLDYGLLALDLRQLQQPGGAQQVRMRWVRDFHRPTPITTASDTDTPTDPTTAEPAGDPT